MSGPIFGLCWEHLSILSRIIGFIRSQTRRNASRSTIAEANLDDTRSIFVRSRERSTSYRVKRSSDVAFFPCGAVCMESLNSWRLQVRGFVYNVLLFCTSNQAQLSTAFKQCARCFLEMSSLSCLTVCSQFPPEKPTLNQDIWLRHDRAIWAAKHLELVHVHHLASLCTGFKITAKAIGKNSVSCFSAKNKFAHAMQWSMSAKFGIFVCF